MDLVEIRKKARAEQAEQEQELSIDSSLTDGRQERPPIVPPETRSAASGRVEEPFISPPPVTISEESDDSLIEQLFNSDQGLELASEESYLQALVNQDEDLTGNREQWLTFHLGGEEYALPIRHVQEIIKPREITELPRVPRFLLGVISLRGLIIPVIDLRNRLDFGQINQSTTVRIVICEDGDRVAGLLVDSITQVIHLAEDDQEPPPTMLTGIDRELVEGVGRHQGRMVILLDLPGVLAFDNSDAGEKGVWHDEEENPHC